jgi:hypothetical protein
MCLLHLKKKKTKREREWFEKDIRLWFETWFAKVVLDSRDSVVLETWFEKMYGQIYGLGLKLGLQK